MHVLPLAFAEFMWSREYDEGGVQHPITREVDFVANLAGRRYYIQSAFAIPDTAKAEQEKASLLSIDDFHEVGLTYERLRDFQIHWGKYVYELTSKMQYRVTKAPSFCHTASVTKGRSFCHISGGNR